MLHAKAPLVTGGQLVRLPVQTGEAGRIDRECKGRSGSEREPRIIHLDRRGGINLQAERNVWTGVVHVISLNAFVHHAGATTNDRLPLAVEVVCKSDAWTECGPVIVHQALWYTVLTRNTYSVEVERNAGENRVRAGPQAWAGWVDRAVRIEQCGFSRIV